MKTVLSVLSVLVISVLGVAPAQALHCTQWQGTFCLFWAPDPPSGAFDCTNDMTAYPGEFLAKTAAGYCMGFSGSQLPSAGDFNDIIVATKNCQSGAMNIYEHNNYGGSSIIRFVDCNTWVNVSSGWNNKVSSFKRQ
jgi:hypothetical protein